MTRLNIALLGPIQIQLDGKPIPLAYDKVRALLAYLTLESARPLRRDTLTSLLWPEYSDKEARHSLSQALLKLRQSIDPNGKRLLANRHTIQLNLDADVGVDVTIFEMLLQNCKEHAHIKPENCAVCVQSWQKAVTLYQGEFLSGLSITGSPAFDNWLAVWRERLHHQAIYIYQSLANYYERRGELNEAITYARQQVTLEPWREEAHRQLMRLLLYSGERSAALAQFLICAQALDSELGVVPSAETEALHKQIQASEVQTPHNLPEQTTPFLGRKEELAQIASFLADPDCRLLTLTGPGGIGKTRLALAVAQKQLNRPKMNFDLEAPTYSFFTHGVYWVPLTGVESATSLIPAITETLGLQLEAGGSQGPSLPAEQQLIDYLRQKQLLLLLDNFEQLLQSEEGFAATSLLKAILHQAPRVKLLITSRERLQLAEEQLYPLQGLSYPDTNTADAVEYEYDSLSLFTQTAQRIRPDFLLTNKAKVAIGHICRLLFGMPLAVELAASSINILSPKEIAAELRQSLDLLATSSRHIPDRHRSMRAAFDTSWQRLTPTEQSLLAELSVFRGGFTLQAAQAITSAMLPNLSSLINQSLLRFKATQNRYDLHELLRQYVAEKLAQNGEKETIVRDQHARFYTSFLQAQEPLLKSSQQPKTLAAIEADHENVCQGWHWACQQGKFDWLQNSLEAIGIFHQKQSRFQEAQNLLQVALQALENSPSPRDELILQARLWAWKSLFDQRLGAHDAAEDALERSLILLKNGTSKHPHFQNTLASANLQMGNLLINMITEEAVTYFEASLLAFRETKENWRRAEALFGLASSYHIMGRYSQSKPYLDECLILRKKNGDKHGLAETLALLNVHARFQGKSEEGERLVREAIQVYAEIGDRVSRARSFWDLGTAYNWVGRHEEAYNMLKESLSIYLDLGNQTRLASAHGRLSVAELLLGQYEPACHSARGCIELSEAVNDQNWISIAYMVRSWLAMATGNFRLAQTHAQRSYQAARKSNFNTGGWGISALAYTEIGLGHLQQAQAYLIDALKVALEKRDFITLLFMFIGQAWLWLVQAGDSLEKPVFLQSAIELYTLAYRFPLLGNTPIMDEVVGVHFREVIEKLPNQLLTPREQQDQVKFMWERAESLLNTLSRTG